jgi:hypothetical protein
MKSPRPPPQEKEIEVKTPVAEIDADQFTAGIIISHRPKSSQLRMGNGGFRVITLAAFTADMVIAGGGGSGSGSGSGTSTDAGRDWIMTDGAVGELRSQATTYVSARAMRKSFMTVLLEFESSDSG